MLEDLENLILQTSLARPVVENLIVDECSMVDLERLAILLHMLKLKGEASIKRVILVGDENQLPPIGLGKPFFDVIDFLKRHKSYRENNYIQLTTNCRQKFDESIIKVAELFAGKNRYYEELLDTVSSGKYSSPGLHVELWNTKAELLKKIDSRLSHVIETELKEDGVNMPAKRSEQLNLLFGLYENGHVKSNNAGTMQLDRMQLITPYRAGFFGTIGVNKFVKDNYREPHFLDWIPPPIPFTHAEKIMRTVNWYKWIKHLHKRDLLLSNGSIGVVCNKFDKYGAAQEKFYRQYFFPDAESDIRSIDDDENFELAYAITIHKSQGSEFKNVFLVIPGKETLLSRELLYTALTRSTDTVTLFLQTRKGTSLLETARNRSFIMPRMTSIFDPPDNYRRIFEPKTGVPVKSKIEYILFKALQASGLDFAYEQELELSQGEMKVTIKPDFTIQIGNKTYYWEHLGELDERNYSTGWKERRQLYEANGRLDKIITTDDLGGVLQERIDDLIGQIKSGKLLQTPQNKYSVHHYQLYS
jgi:hypothetical protein